MSLKEKLTSRKFIVAIIGIIVGLATAFGVDESEYATIAGAVLSVVSAISYIFAEAKIDAAAVLPAETEEEESENDE